MAHIPMANDGTPQFCFRFMASNKACQPLITLYVPKCFQEGQMCSCFSVPRKYEDYYITSIQSPFVQGCYINSLTLGNLNQILYVIFKWILVIDGWDISCEIALRWMSLDFTNDQSILVQAMAWCCQATSHYLSQCWPRSLSPYGVTRPKMS